MTSDAHKMLAARCRPWVRRRSTKRGMRAGFEVPLANGYVADWVGLCGFQWSIRRQYVADELLKRIGAVLIDPEFACVFEVKVSRSDYQKTFGHGYAQHGRAEARGSLHWVVAPRGVVEPEELPEMWGLLQPMAGGLRVLKRAPFCPLTAEALHRLAYYVLWYGKETA